MKKLLLLIVFILLVVVSKENQKENCQDSLCLFEYNMDSTLYQLFNIITSRLDSCNINLNDSSYFFSVIYWESNENLFMYLKLERYYLNSDNINKIFGASMVNNYRFIFISADSTLNYNRISNFLYKKISNNKKISIELKSILEPNLLLCGECSNLYKINNNSDSLIVIAEMCIN